MITGKLKSYHVKRNSNLQHQLTGLTETFLEILTPVESNVSSCQALVLHKGAQRKQEIWV